MKSIKKIYSQSQTSDVNRYRTTWSDADIENHTSVNQGNGTRKSGAVPASDGGAGMEAVAKDIIHEIRNPLTAISLAAQAMHEEVLYDGLPKSVNPLFGIISKNIDRIEGLLKDLLYINSGCEVQLTPTDLCEVIESSLRHADDRIFFKRVDVTRSFSPGILVNADADKLSTAFLNIIINAVEAVPKNEGKLWIAVYPVNNEIKVVFKDNGSGMDAETMLHMFDKSSSQKRPGRGVGLLHVKQILDKHGAGISVNSELGTGTTLVITFRNSR